MNSQESEKLYSQIRANTLARHFALGRYWRRNIICEDNHLGNKTNMNCAQTAEKPTKADGSPLFIDAKDLIFNTPNSTLDLSPERWRVARREHANPLLQSGMNLTRLAVEAKLGNHESLKIITLSLKTIDSLFKFKGDPIFDGYILRFDPVTCDNWVEYPKKNEPCFCCNFLPNLDPRTFKDNQYNYSTPEHDGLVARNSHDPGKYRMWEPSFDEISGLLGGYYMLWYCLNDNTSQLAVDIVNEVKAQSDRLGRYLRDTAYVLVKPGGGFVYMGGSGVGSIMEIMYSRALSRIYGRDYDYYRTPHHTFEDALKLGGVWHEFNLMMDVINPGCPEFPFRAPEPDGLDGLSIPAPLLDALDAQLLDHFQVSYRHLMDAVNTPLMAPHWPNILKNALYVLANCHVFNVRMNVNELGMPGDGDQRLEFALGYVYKRVMEIDERAMYRGYFTMKHGFAPWLGLMALGDEDPFYKNCYLDWFNAMDGSSDWNDADGNSIEEVHGAPVNRAFYTALALLLGGETTAAVRLDAQLSAMYTVLTGDYRSNLILDDCGGDRPGDAAHEIELMDAWSHYYGFALPQALKWLYQSHQRTGCIGAMLPWFFNPPEIPTAESMANWPKAIVPKQVIQSLACFSEADGNLYPAALEYLPLEYTKVGISSNYYRPFLGGGIPHPFEDIDLFEDPVPMPTVQQVSLMPPPISEEHLIEIAPQAYFRYTHRFSPPQFPPDLPRECYELEYQLIPFEQSGWRPKVSISGDTAEVTIEVKLSMDWIQTPPGSGIYAPDLTTIRLGYFKGAFYYAWVFTSDGHCS